MRSYIHGVRLKRKKIIKWW